MCVLAFAWKAHPRWRLVAAGNRDELHARPAADLARWDAPDYFLAGKDLQSGGTWLGVSEEGRFAVVTNVRGYGVAQPGRPSRGALVADFLRGDTSHDSIRLADLANFNSFNLIVADGHEASFFSNRPSVTGHTLVPGVYGLANGTLDESWPKTVRLKGGLEAWLASDGSDAEVLLDLLRDEVAGGAKRTEEAPDVDQSPIFIRNLVYGTRCSTVVMIDEANSGLMIERRYSPEGEPLSETRLPFRWP